MYGIVHPDEQWESGRPVRVSPVYERERELGAVFHETAGWERPFWYERNRDLLDQYRGQLMDRGSEWESRWWSPIINAEHLAMRERAGLFDLSAFAILDVTGPGALQALQKVAVAQLKVPVGRVVYTSFLDDAGGFRADLTIMRLGPRHFRVVTGGATGMADYKWITDHLPDDGSAAVADVTSAWTTFGLWGPKARAILGHLTSDDISNAGFALRHLQGDRGRGDDGARVPHLLCRRARLGAVRARGAGREAVGRAVLRGPRLRHGPGGHRRLRHDRPAGEGLPRLRGRAGCQLHAGRGRDDAAEGQGAGLRREGRLPAAARGAAGRGAVHADRRRSRLRIRRAAVHARRRAGAVGRRRAAD